MDIVKNNILVKNIQGVPQSSILGPVLSNIYAHYIIDIWFDNEIRPNLKGVGTLTRYCDDLVITLTEGKEAERVIKLLNERLERGSLKLNIEKTKVISFVKFLPKTKLSGAFNFLGFTFYVGKSQRGYNTIKLKTSRKSVCNKLKEINVWCREMRCILKLKEQWNALRLKLEGYIRYYAVSFNSVEVSSFIYQAKQIFFKWCNRRSQKKSLNREKFGQFEKEFPLPKVRVVHRLF